MEARRSEIENIRVFELQSKAQYGQVSAEDVESLRQEVAHLASLGFYSRLEDVIRASVYAIDILATVEQPDSQVDEPPSPTYPNPGTYARDMWIYDSIHRFSCDTLSRKLKEKAKAERWTIISSRNGFKKAADRYADFHKLERRRFKAD